ncbi:esterase [Mesorhizobium sp. L-8-10]|uniref:alpha/beta hydrolase n=1 Tax=Mesorhizobium sp. L-8-10 TaxID=2744523 RepID=UPI0019295DD3|nr:alpha/beta fold hydrolase [Mesorhizobium sp. L-8-10]BCH31282.1 esterase [Mesorhizobium sp. L-8-10]
MGIEPGIMAGAEPYSAKGGRHGALVIHGFTGCPQSMRPLGKAFADAGFTVEVPRLPGHGTTPDDMNRTGWSEWTAAADAAYRDLAARTDSVVVAGLSMGGSLTLWLAQQHPEIKGIVLINPAVKADDFGPFAEGAKATLAAGERFLPAIAGDIADPSSKELGYDKTPAQCLLSLLDGVKANEAGLSRIKSPALILHSQQDHVIPPGSVELLRARLGGTVEYATLDKSFHVATLDYDAPEIHRRAVAFGKLVSG